MKLESQVTSLELSKKLKELGVGQESLYSWIVGYDPNGGVDGEHIEGSILTQTGKNYSIEDYSSVGGEKDSFHNSDHREIEGVKTYRAYTVAELGNILKNSHGSLPQYSNQDCNKKWFKLMMGTGTIVEATTEANARAKMLIYLLSNNLIEV